MLKQNIQLQPAAWVWNTVLLGFQTTHIWTVNKCSRGILVHSSLKNVQTLCCLFFRPWKNNLVASSCKHMKKIPYQTKHEGKVTTHTGGSVGFVVGFFSYIICIFWSTFIYLKKVLARFCRLEKCSNSERSILVVWVFLPCRGLLGQQLCSMCRH